MEHGTGSALWDELPPLWRRGLLDHQDVRAPTLTRPVWVYRITDLGVAAARGLTCETYPDVPMRRASGGKAGVYAPERQRGGLLILRAAYEDPAVPVRFGGRGWLTGRGLGARVEARNRSRTASEHAHGTAFFAVDATDLRWLVAKGLVERRGDPERPNVVWWRVTELGRTVPLLDWKPIPRRG